MASFFIIDTIVLEIIGSVGILSNSLQLALMIRRKHTKTPFDISVLGLCIADLLSAMLWFSFHFCLHLYLSKKITMNYEHYYITSRAGLTLSVTSSFLHTLFIAVQRSFAVFLPFRFRIYFTRQRCLICLVFIWLMSILTAFLVPFFRSYTIISLVIINCGWMLVVCYAVLCYVVYRQRAVVTSIAAHNRNRNQTNRKTMAYCVLVTISFLICTFPFALLWGEFLKSTNLYFHYAAVWPLGLNAVFDSLLYFMFRRNKNMTCYTSCCGHCCSPRKGGRDDDVANSNRISTRTLGDIKLTTIPRNVYLGGSGNTKAMCMTDEIDATETFPPPDSLQKP